MNEEEILNSLRQCAKDKSDCSVCSLRENAYCFTALAKGALDIIENLSLKVKNLNAAMDYYRGKATEVLQNGQMD